MKHRFIASFLWVLLFLGGMLIAPLILMSVGVYFDIDFIIDSIYAMNDFSNAIATTDFAELAQKLAKECAVFVHISMCLGYVPVIVAMLILKNDNGGYSKLHLHEIDNILKWISVSMTASCILDFIMQACCKLPCFSQQASLLFSVNVLSTAGLPWLALLTVGVLAPIVEEITFRYGIQKNITDKYNSMTGIVVSSLVFGITHLNLLQGIFAALMGAILGYVYHRTGNLWYTTIIHMINNSACVLTTICGLNSVAVGIAIPVVTTILYCIAKYFSNPTKLVYQ